MRLREKLSNHWFFIRQDIVTYLISTILYLGLCLIKNPSLNRLWYSLFECLVFYIPFWFIRICFCATYHSDNWYHCKKWTRIMLCSGVIAIWLFPIQYSLAGCIGVALLCCVILYLVAIEVEEKKSYKKENQELQEHIEILLNQLEHKDIWAMNEDELYEHCRQCGLSEEDCKIAYFIVIERLKGKELYEAIRYSESQTKRKRKSILDKIK